MGQLSGTVTINSMISTAGSNYQTFTALASTLNAVGISGPLYIDVVPNTGPYLEQPVFNQIAGASSTNTITINGNNNILRFNSTNLAQPWTLLLNGSDYFFVHFLKVEALGTSYALACLLTNNADNNTFSACTFSCIPNGTGFRQIPLSINGSSLYPINNGPAGSNNTFSNCEIRNGIVGVALSGFPGVNNSIVNCSINDWYGYGIYAQQHQLINLQYNSIARPTRSVVPLGNTVVYGMAFGTPTLTVFMTGINCVGNCIQNIFGGAPNALCAVIGIRLFNPNQNTTTYTNNCTFNNNLIYNLGANTGVAGMDLFYPNGSVSNNTIIIDKASPTGTASNLTCLKFGELNFNPITITNNYFQITQGPSAQSIGAFLGLPLSSPSLNINNNRYHIASNASQNYIGYSSVTGYASLFSQWQAGGYDLQGTNYVVNPNISISSNCGYNLPAPVGNFTSPSGHLCPKTAFTFTDNSTNNPTAWQWSVSPSNNANINQASTPQPQITFNAPGVYTVYLTASNFVGPGAVYSQTLSIANSPSITVTPTLTSLCLGSSVQFTAQGALSYTWSTGQISSVVSYTPLSTSIFSVTGSDAFGCTTTLGILLPVYPIPNVLVSASDSVICANANQISALSASGASSYTWMPGNVQGNAVGFSPLVPTTYTCIGSSNEGCQNTATLFINVSACLGITNQEELIHTKVFPNPFQNQIQITKGSSSFTEIQILNSLGQVLLRMGTEKETTVLDLSALSSGLYFVRVKEGTRSKVTKLMKE